MSSADDGGPEHTVWQGRDVAPDDIEQAMRALERERFQAAGGALPARALNLIVIVDAAFAGEVIRRIDAVGRNAPSRTILLRVSPHRAGLNARVTLTSCAVTGDAPRAAASLSERVTISVGTRHVARLESIVDPVVMPDVPTLVWAPHGHRAALDAVVGLSQTALLDSTDAPSPSAGLDTVHDLLSTHDLGIVDLAWLRVMPWRLRLAAHYVAPRHIDDLTRIDSVVVRHDRESGVAGWLLLGWFGDRLGWTIDEHGVRDRAGEPVRLELVPVDVGVQGLAGTTITTRTGASFSLDRRVSGLRAHEVDGDGERRWTLLGASRGETGVLSGAFRRTLVPDDGYIGAVAAARALLGAS